LRNVEIVQVSSTYYTRSSRKIVIFYVIRSNQEPLKFSASYLLFAKSFLLSDCDSSVRNLCRWYDISTIIDLSD